MNVFQPKINQFSKIFEILLEIDKTHKNIYIFPKISFILSIFGHFTTYFRVNFPIQNIKEKSHFQAYLAALKRPQNCDTSIFFNSVKRFQKPDKFSKIYVLAEKHMFFTPWTPPPMALMFVLDSFFILFVLIFTCRPYIIIILLHHLTSSF